ncbi:cob(I)alamin adenosyltransferase [Candidatus Hakubella thermalkaliphila]|uniref:Cob(I)alamin adenosyltransferase n=3 Tax=Candidatus Hakubella thermalkaliphila TaxID=2754717 RepID=A0A6V8NGQ0_9ACTN|nr:cob(I)yrinic acid a,c-diamide adenosyltransferase [Candidatus Hakubella thermalkaliphila]GFP19428.1 cob(I)alamin adenosyltransferase [Candidatus Hakubella thermalkaliphila]
MDQRKGLIQVYTGSGKGKTTAALGLALRAVGRGYKVMFIQFIKQDRYETGEVKAAEMLSPYLKFARFGQYPTALDESGSLLPDMDIGESVREALQFARKVIREGEYDLVVLDEINVALDRRLITLDEVIGLIKEKPDFMELVLTGRNAHPKIVEMADLVTEMREVKHPFNKGIRARRGIEF